MGVSNSSNDPGTSLAAAIGFRLQKGLCTVHVRDTSLYIALPLSVLYTIQLTLSNFVTSSLHNVASPNHFLLFNRSSTHPISSLLLPFIISQINQYYQLLDILFIENFALHILSRFKVYFLISFQSFIGVNIDIR